MKQMVRGLMTMGLLIVASGCYEHTYTVGQGAPVGPVVYSEWHSSWLGGLIGERNIVVARVCPSGNATIHDEMSFLNGLVATLTAGIYTPTEVKIRCDTGVAGGLQLDEQDVQSIVSSIARIAASDASADRCASSRSPSVQAVEPSTKWSLPIDVVGMPAP